jgi:predicted permease
LLSIWTVRGLLHFLPSDGTLLMLRAQPDLRILGFTVGLAALTSVFFGLAPAWQATRVDLWNTLKDVVGAVAGTGGSARLRKALVTLQVALSFLLLSGAGLFVKSLQHLKDTKTGFREMDNLVTFRVDPSLNGYTVEREKAFYKQLLDNIRAAPGVKLAGIASNPLLHGWESDSSMGVEGHQAKDGEDIQAYTNNLSPGYFQTMGVPLLEGRDFEEREAGDRATVAIVNRKFAQHFFGDKSAVGRRVGFGVRPDKLDIEIVGVVEDTLYDGPREGVRRQVFVPRFQSRFPGPVTYYVRAGMESKALFTALGNEVKKLDPAMPVFEMKTLEAQLDETLGTERMIAALSVAFGALATLLAAIGLYGVLAFVVARRTKEIGVRMALGAQPSAVLWLVMKEVLLLLAGGLAVGIPAAYLLSRYFSAQLYGVQPADLGTALAATAVLSLVALSAGFAPARRASAISPIQALRYE